MCSWCLTRQENVPYTLPALFAEIALRSSETCGVHMSEDNPFGSVSYGRNRRDARRREPAESRLQPGLAAPQSRPICQSAAGLPTRPTKCFRTSAQVEGFWEASAATVVGVHSVGKLGDMARNAVPRPQKRPQNCSMESMSYSEFPESVNAARMSACATCWPATAESSGGR